MLATFTPVAGPVSGTGYQLPIIQDQDIRTPGLVSSEMMHMAGTPGDYDGMGTDATDTQSGTIECTFFLSDNWLLSRGYQASIAGREHAIRGFVQAVCMGGLGTLTDQWTDTDGTTVRTATTKARCVAHTMTRSATEVWTIQCTFEVPSSYWTDYSGTLLLLT